MAAQPVKIGVLALQGDAREHALALSDLGADAVEVRTPEHLAGVDALVLPGGESTTMSLLLGSSGLHEPIARRLRDGMPALGVVVAGVSTQTVEYQREFVERTHVPFDLLSDADLRLTRALRLPTFEFPVASGGPTTLIRRMAWYLDGGRIEHVWYPVFPPDRNAETVLAWLRSR